MWWVAQVHWIWVVIIFGLGGVLGIAVGVMIAGSGVLDETPQEKRKREKNPF